MAEDKQVKAHLEPEIQLIEEKTIIITGGTTGIGRATANLLAKKGANIVIFRRHRSSRPV